MNDEKELQDSIKTTVQVGGKGGYNGIEASFTASAGFRDASKSFESNSKGRAQAEATCSTYTANIMLPPCMS
jgi:hypothetical protein